MQHELLPGIQIQDRVLQIHTTRMLPRCQHQRLAPLRFGSRSLLLLAEAIQNLKGRPAARWLLAIALQACLRHFQMTLWDRYFARAFGDLIPQSLKVPYLLGLGHFRKARRWHLTWCAHLVCLFLLMIPYWCQCCQFWSNVRRQRARDVAFESWMNIGSRALNARVRRPRRAIVTPESLIRSSKARNITATPESTARGSLSTEI